MKTVKVWILPPKTDMLLSAYKTQNPPTYIFPKKTYSKIMSGLGWGGNGEYITGLEDHWEEDEHPDEVKACQNLALRLELEKEVDNSEELGDN